MSYGSQMILSNQIGISADTFHVFKNLLALVQNTKYKVVIMSLFFFMF
jgi:hypothetical protein